MTLESRLFLCSGICQVLCELPPDKITNAIRAFQSKSLELIERLVGDTLQRTNTNGQSFVFSCLSDEIRVLSRMAHDFTKISTTISSSNDQPFKFSSLDFIGSGWHSMKYIASNFSNEKVR